MQQARWARRWLATNQNASSFAAKIPTITEPTGDGVLNLTADGNTVPKRLKLWPILLGSDNDVSSIRIIGWNRVIKDSSTTLWFPTIIGEFSCTASAAVGIASAAVVNTERFADTITPVAARTRDYVLAAGTATNSDYEVLSPANDTPAHIIMPVAAFEKLELTSDQTTGTSTLNVLYAFLDD